ncbi:hypothetical protein [Pseudomonas sp. Irchel 3E13]|uniref:hypothetical protein n=1 Tax=Pseudomonas sp. Irchel 3E13 TaxID=2008975 RepID=UPI000BA3DA17|nr:hypothetical protein [Pseudomonas sp. Irchel 3E13]
MRYHTERKIAQPMVELFPYRASEGPRTKHDIVNQAASLEHFERERRSEFLERLAVFRQAGNESIRSFPAQLFEPVCNYEMPPAPRVQLHPAREMETHASHHVFDDAPLASISDCGDYGLEPTPYLDGMDGLQSGPSFEEVPPGDYSDFSMGASAAELPAEVLADDTNIDWSRAKEGVVSQLGRYHYKFDKDQSLSYLVRLGRNEYVWGIDLERAINQHKVKKGDRVLLKCIGKQPVEVEVKVKQPDNSIVIEKKTVRRNTWVARVLSRGADKPQA